VYLTSDPTKKRRHWDTFSLNYNDAVFWQGQTSVQNLTPKWFWFRNLELRNLKNTKLSLLNKPIKQLGFLNRVFHRNKKTNFPRFFCSIIKKIECLQIFTFPGFQMSQCLLYNLDFFYNQCFLLFLYPFHPKVESEWLYPTVNSSCPISFANTTEIHFQTDKILDLDGTAFLALTFFNTKKFKIVKFTLKNWFKNISVNYSVKIIYC